MTRNMFLCLFVMLVVPVGAPAWQADPLHDLSAAGVELYNASEYDQALVRFSQAQEYAPESGLLYFNIGNVLHRQGNHEEAEKAFQQTVRNSDDPTLVLDAWFNLGNTRYLAGVGPAGVPSSTQELELWENAIQAYERVLDLDPEHDDAKHNLELVRRRLKQFLDMQRPSEQSEQLKEEADALVAERRYNEALEIMQQVLENDPGARGAYEDYTTRLQDVVGILQQAEGTS